MGRLTGACFQSGEKLFNHFLNEQLFARMSRSLFELRLLRVSDVGNFGCHRL